MPPDHQEIYRAQADRYDRLIAREDYQRNILPALMQITPFAEMTVIEFGAGTGRLTCLLAPLARFIHAFDGSPHMLEVAAAKLRASGLENWRVAVGDHRRISAPDGQADVAIAGWSVCYVIGEAATWRVELDTVLAEMRRVLRPGGMILLLETLGTGCEQPDPPPKLVPYYDYLEAGGFQRRWIRTDYRFADRDEAESLTRFFFGEAMVKKIQTRGEDVLLPECTGIWWKKPRCRSNAPSSMR
jgi:ubiquinone/menaquinone biosynthesis C-methylase UbiE